MAADTLARIEAALARIDQALARQRIAQQRLQDRHRRLRGEVSAAIAALDALEQAGG